MDAAMNGHAGFAKMLIERGASVTAKDKSGRTSLVLASTYGDYPDVARILVAAGADPNAKDDKGRSCTALAGGRAYDSMLDVLGGDASPARVPTARTAVERSLKLIQLATARFEEGANCVSCHQEGLGRIATGEAKKSGFAIDQKLRAAQNARISGVLDALRPINQQALVSKKAAQMLPLVEINEVSDFDSWVLCGMAASGQPGNDSTAVMAMALARQQNQSGAWTFSVPRVPMQSSFFTFTALAVRSLSIYGPKDREGEIALRIAKARHWLAISKPSTSEDRASRLLGLKWSQADARAVDAAEKEVLADQRQDGGWSQLPNLASDAYATGQALYALHVGGSLPVSDGAYKRGVAYLLRSQDDDGSWYVCKRAIPANNYFDASFPHGESQYASFNGTCWATLALLQTVSANVHGVR